MSKKVLSLVALVVIVSMLLVSVAPVPALAQGKKKVTVGAVQMVAFHEWFRTIEMGAKAACDAAGAELLVANAKGQVDTEASMVENFIARGVDAIMISALDSKASVAALKKATDAGIKLVNYNTTIDSPIMETFIGVDNTELGAQAGRWVVNYVAKNMGGKAKIALLTIPKYEVGKQRREGFVAAIGKNPDIKVVAEQEGESPEQGTNTLETIMQGNPDLDLVWAANEGGLVGALTAAKGSKIKVLGTDMSLQVAKALLEPGTNLLAVSTQNPYQEGFAAADTAIKLVNGEAVQSDADKSVAGGLTVKTRQLIPLEMYTSDNKAAVEAYLAKYKVLEEGGKVEAAAPPTDKSKKVTVGAVQMVAFHEWFRTIEMGAKAACDEMGAELLVANAKGQVDTEASMVENFIARGVNGIMISALDSKASVAALKKATDAGIKLVDYNTTIDSPIMETFIGVDNTELGAQAGRWVVDYVAKNMGGKAKIALLTIPKYEVGKQRREGFVAAIGKNPDIKVVAEQEGESPEQGTNTLETIMQGNPDLDLVWAANEGGLVGALTAAKGSKIKVLGTDMSLQVAKALLEPGTNLLAVSTQNPYQEGYAAAAAVIRLARGEAVQSDADKSVAGGLTVKTRQLIPLEMYTSDNKAAVEAYLAKYKVLEEGGQVKQ